MLLLFTISGVDNIHEQADLNKELVSTVEF